MLSLGSSFLLVAQNVLKLFLMIGVGFLLGRGKLIDERGAGGINNVLLYVGIPCMMLSSFQQAPKDGGLSGFLLSVVIAAAIHGISILIAHLTIHEKDRQDQSIFRLASSLCNCVMAVPLQTALLGSECVFYGSAFIMVFHLFSWTYGLYMMTGTRKSLSVRRLIFNPGILGVIVSLSLYLLRVRLPELIMSPISNLAALTVSLPMLVIGYQLSQANFSSTLRYRGLWISSVLRLLVFPALTLGLCLLLGTDRTVLLAIVMAAATPSAAIINMFAIRFNGDSKLSSSAVAISTLLSCVTIPLIVGLAMAVTT